MRICFVCMGNICRSPTAEGVMAKLLREAGLAERVAIDSAGTGAWHIGELPDPRTRAAAKKRGIALDHHARQFTRRDFERFDLVIAMDATNLRHLRLMADQRATPEIRLTSRKPITCAHSSTSLSTKDLLRALIHGILSFLTSWSTTRMPTTAQTRATRQKPFN